MNNKYEKLLEKLKQQDDELSMEAAKAIEELVTDNEHLTEGYNAMFRDLERALSRRKG